MSEDEYDDESWTADDAAWAQADADYDNLQERLMEGDNPDNDPAWCDILEAQDYPPTECCGAMVTGTDDGIACRSCYRIIVGIGIGDIVDERLEKAS